MQSESNDIPKPKLDTPEEYAAKAWAHLQPLINSHIDATMKPLIEQIKSMIALQFDIGKDFAKKVERELHEHTENFKALCDQTRNQIIDGIDDQDDYPDSQY